MNNHERLIAQLSPTQKLLLGGRSGSEALWHSAPDNPAYFAEYAVRFANENRSLPPDFLDTA